LLMIQKEFHLYSHLWAFVLFPCTICSYTLFIFPFSFFWFVKVFCLSRKFILHHILLKIFLKFCFIILFQFFLAVMEFKLSFKVFFHVEVILIFNFM
jgi:hypothetical protein